MQMTSVVLLSMLFSISAAQPAPLPATPPGEFFPLKTQDHQEAASFERGQPILGTTFFYWYDAPSKAHMLDTDGSDALTTHPADMDAISFKSVAWHKTQLADMIDAGIDFLMPVFWGVPGKYDEWSFVGLPPLVEAHTALEKDGLKPPAIGMFYDTSILQWNASNADGSSYHVDLTTDYGREWFYTAIRDFWSQIPPQKWARVDGRPIIFLYDASFAAKQDPERQFTHVKARFREDFGVEPFLVKSPGWQGQADAIYAWGGAVNGPLIFRETVSLGAGIRPQRGPRTGAIGCRASRRPDLHRPLDQDAATRPGHPAVDGARRDLERMARGHGRRPLPRVRPKLHRADASVRGLVAHGHATTIPLELRERRCGSVGGQEIRGPEPAGQQWRRLLGDPRPWARAKPQSACPIRIRQTSRYLYFDIDDAFACGLMEKSATLRVTYRDAGCSSFGVEYDSTVNEGPLEGAFRPAGSVQVGDTGQWKTAEFKLPDCCFMGRCNGADLRLAVYRRADRTGCEPSGVEEEQLTGPDHLDLDRIADNLDALEGERDLDGVASRAQGAMECLPGEPPAYPGSRRRGRRAWVFPSVGRCGHGYQRPSTAN